MKIGNFDLDRDVLVIAEIGNNHEGDLAVAEELVQAAAAAGAGAVKFQTIVPDRLVSSDQTERISQLRKYQLSYDEFERLSRVADHAGVLFLSTPFDIESTRFLDRLVPAFKVASGDNDFFPLLEAVAETGKPTIVSAGLTEFEQIRHTVQFVNDVWARRGIEQDMAVLHCVVSYPTPPHQAQLAAIESLKTLGVTVGYSDHTLGIEAAVLSVALGARIIEKHFTLDKRYSDFRDHQLAADPAELRALVQRVREASQMIGETGKHVGAAERSNVTAVRRSIAVRKDLPAGHVLAVDDLCWLRPGNGFRPGEEARLVGKRLRRAIVAGRLVQPDDLCEEP